MLIIRRLGLAIGAAALVFTGLTAVPASAEDLPPVGTMAYQGCTNGKYFYGGTTGWKSWAKCSLSGGHDFYAVMRCWEGYTRTSYEYPTTGKYTAWTRGGCPTNPRHYGQHIVN